MSALFFVCSGAMTTKISGFGLGYRKEFYDEPLNDAARRVDWFEIVSENFMGKGGSRAHYVRQLTDNYPVAAHGVGMSPGSLDEPSAAYMGALRRLADDHGIAVVSDHLCWTRLNGQNSHDLLPLPYTWRRLDAMVARVGRLQEALGRQLFLENPSVYAAFAGCDLDEGEFLHALVQRSGCGVLLDVNNLYVNAQNAALDPDLYLARLRNAPICYFHLAGHTKADGVLIDTHDQQVCDAVWALYRKAAALRPDVATLIEWDGDVPAYDELVALVDRARAEHAAGLATNAAAALQSARVPRPKAAPSSPGDDHEERAAFATFYDLMTGTCPQDEAEGDPRLAILDQGIPTARVRGINVYNSAYFNRLRDVLKSIVPTVASVFTDKAFNLFVEAYLRQHPPETANVEDVAFALPEYIDANTDEFDFGIPDRAMADLARLELAIETVHGAPDRPVVAFEALAAALTDDDWPELVLAIDPDFVLIGSCAALGPAILAVADGRAPSAPEMTATYYAVYRDGTTPHWIELSDDEYHFCADARSGRTFLELAERCGERRGVTLDEALPSALAYLQGLMARSAVIGWRLGRSVEARPLGGDLRAF